MLTLIRAAALPEPQVNAVINGHEVDTLWPDSNLVLEVDGFAWHGDRIAFEADRLRDAELAARGYTVIRVTWRQLTERPQEVVARLAAALATRSARLAR
jgi:very-short-patch-repair endonuclease